MSEPSVWVAWLLILGFFPAYCLAAAGLMWLWERTESARARLYRFVWDRPGNRLQNWIDDRRTERMIRRVGRFIAQHPTGKDRS